MAAELILSPILDLLFEKLTSEALKRLPFSKGIHEQLEKLEGWLPQIQAVLVDAAHKEITNKFVKRWLDDLQHLAYDIDDVIDELTTKAMHHELAEKSGSRPNKVRKVIPTWFTGFSLSTRTDNKLNNIIAKLQNLEAQKNTLGLIVKDGKSKNKNRRLETTSLPVDDTSIFGRQGDKETLLEMLLGDEPCNENLSILPIVGMGGIGKTTLARILYNEARVKDRFEVKAWVCVSDEFDIFKMSKIIFQSVTGENKEFADLNLLQVALREKLVEKRFLIILDDVWSESYEHWETLVRPFHAGAPGSKVIMTTRKQQLLKKLGHDHPYQLQSLSHDDALSLFSQHALGVKNFDSHPKFRPHGEGIVKKCDGLPLALIALGRLARTKKDEEEWKDLLFSEIWSLQKEDEIGPALRLSYHDLPAHLKQLFAYCSLFPKDYLFDKEELILLWMAEGFLHQSTTRKSTEDMGYEYFEELLSRSFFMHAPNEESLYVMHDLMNDLATSVAGDVFIRLDNNTDTDVRKEALEKYRHMSFVRQEFEVYGKFEVFKRAKSLRTFLALSVGVKESWQRFSLSNKVLVDLLPELLLLRVLCLSDYEISEIPESIGSLKHLRYLNLSRTRITHLPESIGDLYNLQTLFVCGCKQLTKLPNNFSKLKNLRHLDISDTPCLKALPLGIGELKCLQTLSKVIIEGANGFAISELKDMKDLHGRICIKGLDKVKSVIDAKNANLLDKKFYELEMEWSDVFDGGRNVTLEKDVLNVLKPQHDKLKRLGIVSYGGIEFPSWVGDPSFVLLAHVTISGCTKCTTLPPLGRLPLLKELFVEAMDEVKVVGSELFGASLEILSFVDMSGWEVWSANNGDTGKAFPCLRELSIENCPNLVEASLETLPSLRGLRIRKCRDVVLRSLVHATSMVTWLGMRDISGLTQLHGGVIEHLGAVEQIYINSCRELRYLWESEAEVCKILVNLRSLKVWKCENLVSLGEREDDDNCGGNLTSLTYLGVFNCMRLEHCIFPNSIKILELIDCPSLKLVSINEKPNTLFINDCEKLLENETQGGKKTRVLFNTSMQMLDNVRIRGLPNLKSILGLSCFIHLTSLYILGCENLESFPDHELPNLTALRSLTIEDCPSMDDSFPRGLWPPKLKFLSIGKLKKPISKWGPQNLPTSLSALSLCGGRSEDVSSSSQLSHLLPSSLTHLGLIHFGHLESFSMGLEHLTSLQVISITGCPKMRDLPEALLPSLLQLNINECPKLKERCSRTGFYWPLISGIPSITAEPRVAV